ncbi:mycothiol transferase [Streptomyces sp. NPDC001770]
MDADFEDLVPERAQEDYARPLEDIRLADETVTDASLDDTSVHRGETYSLRLIRVHLIAEYTRHAGHADLLRERLGGVAGDRLPYDSPRNSRSWGRAGGLNRRVRVRRTV